MRFPPAGALLALLGVAACEIPTALPKYDMVWNVPSQSTTIAVNNFLPAGVSLTADSAAFQVSTSPSTTTITRTLGQDCASCAANDGLIIPKPAFTGGGTATVTLPAGVTSAALVRDTLAVTITNNFNFDPLRPSAAPGSSTGTMKIAVTSGAATLGSTIVDGATTALPAGGSLNVKIPLTGNVSSANGIVVTTTLTSPLGDPVQIHASQTSVVTGATSLFFVSNATVNITGKTITSQASTVDLSGVDSGIANHSDGGELELTITNPFAATGTLQVNLTGGGTPITKSVNLAAGTSLQTITFTKADLQNLFGHSIQLTMSGTVTGNAVTVQPGQIVTVASRLQVSINPGGN